MNRKLLIAFGLCIVVMVALATVGLNAQVNGPTCDNPAVTDNGEFEIELLDVQTTGDLVTFEYQVCRLAPAEADLSHWVVGLGQIECLADGFEIEDLVVGGAVNGDPAVWEIVTDPTTGLFGFKFDDLDPTGCDTYTVTFDTSVLADGFTLCTGCVAAATKAGNQDIRDLPSNPAPPGFATIAGPVCCQDEEEPCYVFESETGWGAGPRYNTRGNWATYTSYSGVAKSVTLFAGQTQLAGQVSYSAAAGGTVQICVTLNENWAFADVGNNVKIQGYTSAPSGNPAPGQFAHKGSAGANDTGFCIVVPVKNFFGVHVDLVHRIEVPCPEECLECGL